MTGYKTYTGILILILAQSGLFEKITPEQFSQYIDLAITIIGFALSIIGAIHKDVRLGELENTKND
jgi:hypothetical protein